MKLFHKKCVQTWELTGNGILFLLVKCSPFVVLFCGQCPCLYKLLQQQAHVLPGNGAAFESRLHAVPHKNIEQRGTIELCHTLQRFLQSQKKKKQAASVV